MFTQLRLAFSLAEKYHCKSIGPALKFSVPLEKLPGKLKLGMVPEEPLSSHIRQNTCYSFSNINQQLLNNLQSPLATSLVCNPWVHTFHHLTSWTEPALGMENRKDSRALSVTQKRAESPGELGRDYLESYPLIKRERKKKTMKGFRLLIHIHSQYHYWTCVFFIN